MFFIIFFCCVTQALPINKTDIKSNDDHMNITATLQKINTFRYEKSRTWNTLASFTVGGLLAALNFVEEIMDENDEYDDSNHIRLRRQETTTVETTTNLLSTTESTMPTSTDFANIYNDTILPIIKLNDSVNEIYSEQIRFTRQEKLGKNKTEDKAREDDAEDEDDGGGGGLLGAIISGFLGSLSKPDGGVDINAVVNVIGSLSTLQENGTYDFSGLTNTLSAFFGGGEDGGGSDVGSFAGGLAAASIAGIASPPGAKGAGNFVGNLLKQVLPALSAPDPSESNDGKPQEGDAGGFLFSLLNSLFGTPPSANNPAPSLSFYTIKMNLIKFLFQRFHRYYRHHQKVRNEAIIVTINKEC